MRIELRDAALGYLSEGRSIVPACWTDQHGRCQFHDGCEHAGKRPLVPWKDYQERLPTEAEVRDWWTKWPEANILMVTGAISGVTTIDVDGDQGKATYVKHLNSLLPPTLTRTTPHQGIHRDYRYHPRIPTGNGLLPGIDIKSDGGLVVVPPSRIGDVSYEVTFQLPMASLEGAVDGLLKVINGHEAKRRPSPDGESSRYAGDAPRWIAETMASGVPKGQRNDMAFRLASYFHSRSVPADIIETVLLPFAERCDPPMDSFELQRTIRSATMFENAFSQPLLEAWEKETSLNILTARELSSQTPEDPGWIVEGYVAPGVITEVVGKPKVSGKTTWVLHAISALLAGESFMGRKTKLAKVLYLTEERPATFRHVLGRTGLLGSDDLFILNKSQVPLDMSWPEVMTHVVREAKERGAGMLVVDTVGAWAELRADSENFAGAALTAMKPLQEAAAAGLAVLVPRHERRAGGATGDSGRGSSAYTGAVDISLQLSRHGDSGTNRRILRGVGRFDDTPAELVIELRDGDYVALGDSADAATVDARQQILDVLPDTEDEALTEKDLVDRLGEGASKGTVGKELRQLVEKRILKRVGGGKKNDAYRYFHPDVSFSQPTNRAWEKENSNGQSGDRLVQAALDIGAETVSVHQDNR